MLSCLTDISTLGDAFLQGIARAGGARVAGRKRRALLDLLDQVAGSSSAPQLDTSPGKVQHEQPAGRHRRNTPANSKAQRQTSSRMVDLRHHLQQRCMPLQENGPLSAAKLAPAKASTQPACVRLQPPSEDAVLATVPGQMHANGAVPEQPPQPGRQLPTAPSIPHRVEAVAAGPAAEQQQACQSPAALTAGPPGTAGVPSGPPQPVVQHLQTPRPVTTVAQLRTGGSDLGVFSPSTPPADHAEEAMLAQLEAAALAGRTGAAAAAAASTDPSVPVAGFGAPGAARLLEQRHPPMQRYLAAAATEVVPRLAHSDAQPDAHAAQHPQQLHPLAPRGEQGPVGLMLPSGHEQSVSIAACASASAAQPAAEGVEQPCQEQAAAVSKWAGTGGVFSDSDDDNALFAEVEALERQAS